SVAQAVTTALRFFEFMRPAPSHFRQEFTTFMAGESIASQCLAEALPDCPHVRHPKKFQNLEIWCRQNRLRFRRPSGPSSGGPGRHSHPAGRVMGANAELEAAHVNR